MAEDRKARLKALAARAGRTKAPAPDREEGQASMKPTISFRNYAPADTSLEGESSGEGPSKRPRTAQEEDEPSKVPVSSSDALKNALAEAQKDASKVEATTVTDMAPKKSNWDLKRDISDKLARLEKRTQKALVELLKERLELEAAKAMEEGKDSDLD